MVRIRRMVALFLVLSMFALLLVAAAGASPTDTALYNFENGTHGFTGTNGSTLSSSSDRAFNGTKSLKMAINSSGASSNYYAKLSSPVGLTVGTTYTIYVWVPDNANLAGVQPYVMDSNWSWTGSLVSYSSLAKNAWNALTLTIPATAVNPMNEIGVQVPTTGAFNGNVYIDSIGIPAPDPSQPSPAGLSDLKVNGVTVPGFTENYLSYIVHVPNGTTSVTVTAVKNDPGAVATIVGGNALAAGENAITVKVTAPNSTERTYAIKAIRAYPANTGKRITIQGTKFYAGNQEIWFNGANTPWDNWNDFGGDFDFDWWDNHFQQLKNTGVNATRVWLSGNGEVGFNIGTNGLVSGATAQHWNDLDSLFYLAQKHGIYIMATLLSFDHMKNYHPNYQSWRNMVDSDTNIDSFVTNYVGPFADRYKNNPYVWSADLMNEPDWAYEESGITWARLQTLFAKMSVGVHANSDILTTVGIAMVKYNGDTCDPNQGCQGNKVGDSVLMSKVSNNPLAKLDYWSVHYYDWMGQYWGVPMYMSPAQYGMSADRPNILGESTAKGTVGNTLTSDIMNAYANGWQGIMPWTSNGVDTNGNMSDLAPAASAFYALHSGLVYPLGN